MQDVTRIPTSPEVIDDEIDLRKYIDILIAWRWEILTLAVASALLAATAVIGLRFLQAPQYAATATVAIARTSSNINFDENFRTTLTEQNLTASARADVLVTTRRAALVGLVANGAVAEAVAATLDSTFDAEERVPSRLMGRIEAEAVTAPGSRTEGDLIQITASADTPEKAAALANAWAQAYVEHVNRLYGEVPATLMASVQNEQSQVQAEFDTAQRNLEAFISNNEISRLDRQIAEKQQIINSLQAGKQTAIQTIIDEELNARRQIISAYINALSSNRLLAFNKEQEAKRAMIAALIDADTGSRLAALQKDQEARRTLFNQYVQADIENRTLALTTDQTMRRRVFEAYTTAEATNLLAAFQKDQESRRKLFEQYVQAEMDNRALALATDQEQRRKVFEAYASADTRGKVTAFNAQVDARLQALAQSYNTRQALERLLGDARGLLAQAQGAGEGGQATNTLALLQLKSQVYNTAGAATAAPLQLRLDNLVALSTDTANQVAELTTLVSVIEDRIAELTTAIETQTAQIVSNQGYTLLDGKRPADDPLFAAILEQYASLFELGDLATQDTAADGELASAILSRYEELFDLGPLAQVTNVLSTTTPLAQSIQAQYAALFDVGDLPALDITSGNELSAAIMARYDDLFALGPLAQASTVLTATTPLFETIQQQYPNLFDVGDLSALTEKVMADTGLSVLGNERARELLQLQGLEDLPTYTAAAAPLTEAIDTLEQEIKALQAQREAEVSRRDQLTRTRDLALKSLTTINNKIAELQLASTALTSEVRFASPALPPLRPEERTSLVMATALGGLVGLMLGVFVAFFASYMGKQPPLRRQEAA